MNQDAANRHTNCKNGFLHAKIERRPHQGSRSIWAKYQNGSPMTRVFQFVIGDVGACGCVACNSEVFIRANKGFPCYCLDVRLGSTALSVCTQDDPDCRRCPAGLNKHKGENEELPSETVSAETERLLQEGLDVFVHLHEPPGSLCHPMPAPPRRFTRKFWAEKLKETQSRFVPGPDWTSP
jgi:hypothetical protein